MMANVSEIRRALTSINPAEYPYAYKVLSEALAAAMTPASTSAQREYNRGWRDGVQAQRAVAPYHPCTDILIEGLKDLPGGAGVLKAWDIARNIVDNGGK